MHRRAPFVLAAFAAFAAFAGCSSGSIALGRLESDGSGADAGAPEAGVVDADAVDAGTCLAPAPLHEWRFTGEGTSVPDLRGGGAATLRGGATLDGTGLVRLDGLDDYVDLPNGLLAGLEETSVVLWVRSQGGPAYTRLLDIGTTSLGEDPAPDASYVGRSYLVLTPGTGFVPSELAALTSNAGPPAEVVAPSAAEGDTELHLVAVAFGVASLSLFRDGLLLARVPRGFPLSEVVDHNAWLGRSQYAADPYQKADYASVRVFGRALEACEMAALYREGAP